MKEFTNWLNGVLTNEFPEDMVAVNFNLYEDGEEEWSVEFVGTSSFDEEDPDWACDEVFTTRENPYSFEKGAEWEVILDEVTSWIIEYLNNEEDAAKLKAYQGIGVGFVDGDILILNQKE